MLRRLQSITVGCLVIRLALYWTWTSPRPVEGGLLLSGVPFSVTVLYFLDFKLNLKIILWQRNIFRRYILLDDYSYCLSLWACVSPSQAVDLSKSVYGAQNSHLVALLRGLASVSTKKAD